MIHLEGKECPKHTYEDEFIFIYIIFIHLKIFIHCLLKSTSKEFNPGNN